MKFRLQTVLFRLVFWLATELFFSAIGIDQLADYSEFLLSVQASVKPNTVQLLHIV